MVVSGEPEEGPERSPVAHAATDPPMSRSATRPIRRLVRLAWGDLAMLAVGGSAGPVANGAHHAAREHERHGRVTRKDGQNGAGNHAENDDADMEGVPGVCHG